MEANKVQGEAKAIVLDNGAELTYCERGSENKEVIITTAFYFHTFMPVIEGLAKKYHVYGVVMRFDGPTDEYNADGTVNWARQWGKDVYDFAVKMGIEQYIHVGKCHGTIPGWYMVKEHPEMLDCFASFYLAPHVFNEHGDRWTSLLKDKNLPKLMGTALRKPEEGIKKKMAEVAALGPVALSPEIEEYGGYPERIWESVEDLDYSLKNMTVPVGYCFGSFDPLFQDHFDSNMYAILNTKGARTVFLQGECHLMELDDADKVVSEIMSFIDETRKGFYKEITEAPVKETAYPIDNGAFSTMELNKEME